MLSNAQMFQSHGAAPYMCSISFNRHGLDAVAVSFAIAVVTIVGGDDTVVAGPVVVTSSAVVT